MLRGGSVPAQNMQFWSISGRAAWYGLEVTRYQRSGYAQ
jgi:hypothetical protein